nr:MAG TPA: hypothetical protein [Caudoviricetes sp.]
MVCLSYNVFMLFLIRRFYITNMDVFDLKNKST